MNTIKALLAFSIPLLVSVHGCPKFDIDLRLETFVHPLVAPGQSVAPDELIGSFRGRNELSFDTTIENDKLEIASETFRATPFFHIGRAGGEFPQGFLRMISVEVPRDSSGTITSSSEVFFVKKIGARYIAHLPIMQGELLGSIESWDENQCDGYMLAELRLTEGSLELRAFNRELLDKLIESKTIAIETADGDAKLVTNTAESLTEIVIKYGDKLFDGDGDVFDRVTRRN